MSDFNFEKLEDPKLGLNVPAEVMETYTRFFASKLEPNADGSEQESLAKINGVIATRMRNLNAAHISKRQQAGFQSIPAEDRAILRRSALSGAFMQSLMYSSKDSVRFKPEVAKEIINQADTEGKNKLRINNTAAELDAIYSNRFGLSTEFPGAYRRLLANYMTDQDFREVERQWHANSKENVRVSELQARRAADVLETLEKQFKGMYRIRVGGDGAEIRAEMIDLPGTKVVLLPSRDARPSSRETPEDAAVRNVGTVLMNDNIYALAEPQAERKYGRFADSQPTANVPGNIVMESMLLNTVDARNQSRLEAVTNPDAEGVTGVSAIKVRPTENITNAMLADRQRGRRKDRMADMTINEKIQRGIGFNQTQAMFQVNYKFRSNDGRQTGTNPMQTAAIVAMPQAPVNAISTTGQDRLRDIDAAIKSATRNEDVAAMTNKVGEFDEIQDANFDTLFDDSAGIDFDAIPEGMGAEVELSDDTSDVNFTGVTRTDELAELRARMNFEPSAENPIRVVNFNEHAWYGPGEVVPEGEENYRLTAMEAYIRDDMQRMGVSPTEIRSNRKGSYQIDIPEVDGRTVADNGSHNTIHLALGQLNNYSNDIGGYRIMYNGVTKGAFIPGYRLTINRDNGAPQVVDFKDIVRASFHASMVSQLTNPSAANDTIDPYLALDKVITTYGYGTLFADMNPDDLNESQRLIVEQAKHKARYMTAIADSATMFNAVGEGSDNQTNNQRIQFANNENIRVPALKFMHLFDPYKMSQDGATVYMGVDTLIGNDGTLYSNNIPQITPYSNDEAIERNPELGELSLNDLPTAESPLTIAHPETKLDEQSRNAATAQHVSRLGAEQSLRKANMAYTTSGGFGIGDGFVVSKAFADSAHLHLKGGAARGLIVGDKISDMHGDKGLIVAIVDPEDTDPNMRHLQAIFEGNPDLEVIAPYGTLLSRGTGGVGVEMQNNYIGQLNDVEVDGETIKLSDVSLSEMGLILSDMNATYKTNVYTRDEYEESNRGRSASSQFNAALMALGGQKTLEHIYKNGNYNGQDMAHARLLSDLNVLGYDIDRDGNFGQIDNTALLQDPSTLLMDPRKGLEFNTFANGAVQNGRFGVSFRNAMAEAARFDGTKRIAIKLGENVKLASGASTSAIDRDGNPVNVMFMPVAYLTQLNEIGREQETLITKDAYRNQLKKIWEHAAGNGKRDKSLTEIVNQLSNTVTLRSFGNKKKNVVKSNIYSVALSESTTSVITADPGLPLNVIGISKEMWEAAGSPDPENGERFLVWRDPMLRPTNLAGYKFVVDENLTGIALNPLLADKMDGDFDGDTFGSMFTHDKEVQAEWANELSAENAVQLRRIDMDGNEVSMLDINGDVKMPHLVRKQEIGNVLAESLQRDDVRNILHQVQADLENSGETSAAEALDAVLYTAGSEYLADTPNATSEQQALATRQDVALRLDDLLGNSELAGAIARSGAITDSQLDQYLSATEALDKIEAPDTDYDELQETLFDKGLHTSSAYGQFGLDARSRETIERSITEPVERGYRSKKGAIEKFMNHYDGEQTVGQYLEGAAGNGYKSDFVGIPGRLQQILIARLRGTDDKAIDLPEDASELDRSMNLDQAQRAMRAAMQLTWIATDGTLQAKKAPENGRLIQTLASNDLNNLVKGFPRGFKSRSTDPEPAGHLTTQEWVQEMTDVLTNPNTMPDDWETKHPDVEFQPGLNAGEMLDLRDIQALGEALSDDNGEIRFISDDLEQKRISAFDAICYSNALFGSSDPAAGLKASYEYGLSTQGNKYQNVFVPSEREMWSPSVIGADKKPTRPTHQNIAVEQPTVVVEETVPQYQARPTQEYVKVDEGPEM